ncbi:hypothetical protein [Alteribacillus sp. HJP-4]
MIVETGEVRRKKLRLRGNRTRVGDNTCGSGETPHGAVETS